MSGDNIQFRGCEIGRECIHCIRTKKQCFDAMPDKKGWIQGRVTIVGIDMCEVKVGPAKIDVELECLHSIDSGDDDDTSVMDLM